MGLDGSGFFALVGLSVFSIATIAGVVIGDPFLRFPLLAIGVGGALFVLHTVFNNRITGSSDWLMPRQRRMLLDTGIFVGVTITALTGICSATDVPALEFAIVTLVGIGISLRILLTERFHLVALQIALLTLSFRATIWNAFPVYGQDTGLHLGITGYIASTGQIPSFIESYYWQYPGAHVFGAISEIVTNTPTKIAFFQSIGVAHVLSLVFIYLLVVRIFERQDVALLTTLLVALSGGHLHLGTELYAQTFANVFLPVFLYLIYISGGRRVLALMLPISAIIVVTHNLMPIILVGTGTTLVACRWIKRVVEGRASSNQKSTGAILIGAVLTLVSAGTLYYWSVTDYLAYQVNRVKTIINIQNLGGAEDIPDDETDTGSTSTEFKDPTTTDSPGTPTTTDSPGTPTTTDSPGTPTTTDPPDIPSLPDVGDLGGTPTISLSNITPPPVLSWAGPYLSLGVIATLGGFFAVQDTVENRTLPNPWVLTAFILFGGFSAAFASAGTGAVSRADAAIMIIAAPLFGYVLMNLSRRPDDLVGRGIVVVLVVLVMVPGILSAPVAMSERTDDSFKPLATHQEVSAVAFVESHTDKTATDAYLDGYSDTRQLQAGQQPKDKLTTLLNHNQIEESRQAYRAYLENPQQPFLYRESFNEYYGIVRPNTMNKVYAAGETAIYTN